MVTKKEEEKSSEKKSLKIRLVIPICDRVSYKFYCRDACYPDERMNLLAKAFNTPFKNSSEYTDLVVTSNNFLFIPVYKKSYLHSYIKAFIQGLNPKSEIHLLLGVDSKVKNPYKGISASVFHFLFKEKEWKYQQDIWECWTECDKNCIENQFEDRFLSITKINKNYCFLLFSCGDVLTSDRGNPCIKDDNEMDNLIQLSQQKGQEGKQCNWGLINLAHMDFKIYTKYKQLKYLIATTQISRNKLLLLLEKNTSIFDYYKNENKILYRLCQERRKNNFITISSQEIIALDKQALEYEIINNWENPNSFKNKEELKKVDAFFIDFEILPQEDENKQSKKD